MKGNNLTEEAVAAIFDYSRRQIDYYKTTGPTRGLLRWPAVGLKLRNKSEPPRLSATRCKNSTREKAERRPNGRATSDGRAEERTPPHGRSAAGWEVRF
jgi:hypothetical protein